MPQVIQSIDASTLQALFTHRQTSVLLPLLHITHLGGVFAVFFIGGTVALILMLNHRAAETIGLITTLGGTALMSSFVKDLIARPRPAIFYQAYPETGFSFPSEHTALATALCIFIVYLIFRFTPSEATRTIASFFAIIIIATVGFSRMYLGVHYMSDVIGGFTLGIVMTMIGIMIERSLEHLNLKAK